MKNSHLLPKCNFIEALFTKMYAVLRWVWSNVVSDGRILFCVYSKNIKRVKSVF